MSKDTYARVYNSDGSVAYTIETRFFDERDLEDGQSVVINLPAEMLLPSEIADILDSDAEGDNYHRLATAHNKVWRELDKIAIETVTDKQEAQEVVKKFMLWLLDKGGLHTF